MIYAFPASDFEELVLKYPYARQFVDAHDTVSADYQWAKDARDPQECSCTTWPAGRRSRAAVTQASIRDVAQSLLTTGADAIAVVDGERRVVRLVTVDAVLAWVAAGAGDAGQPIASLLVERAARGRAGRVGQSTACWRSPKPAPTRWP